ncbi:hypothetical protein A3F66_02775 [candidate division TM6 bacterium RIFCSPHIGHO2_12_FULL_32_22]|nr:MAG: hypothetical protein A3F66_02775 [candidate division TM6 bacterium RIFCSPHIGHO2_12_FULL_32_22]
MKKPFILAVLTCLSSYATRQSEIARQKSLCSAEKIIRLVGKLEKRIGHNLEVLLAMPQKGSSVYDKLSEIWEILKRPIPSCVVLQQLQFLKRSSYIVKADSCVVCGEPSVTTCKECDSVAYCSRSHQELDKLRHEPIATKDLSALKGECVKLRRLKFITATHQFNRVRKPLPIELVDGDLISTAPKSVDKPDKQRYIRKDASAILGKRSRKRD